MCCTKIYIITTLDIENDAQDAEIDSTDVELENLVARVDKLEQSQIEPRPAEEDEGEIATPESKYKDWSK